MAREAATFEEVDLHACQDPAEQLDGTVSREEGVAAECLATRLDALKDCECESCRTVEEVGTVP